MMRLKEVSSRQSSLAQVLANHAALGLALGLGFCLLISVIDPQITSLIAHNAEPQTTAIIIVSFFMLMFGVGTTLTGFVLATAESN